MATKLYVGNLPHSVTDDELNELFQTHGTVVSAQVIVDRDTNRSKGFGFVEMSSKEEAEAAIAALNEQEHGGRPLTVNEARPKTDRGPRRDSPPRGGGGGGGYSRDNRNSGGRRF